MAAIDNRLFLGCGIKPFLGLVGDDASAKRGKIRSLIVRLMSNLGKHPEKGDGLSCLTERVL